MAQLRELRALMAALMREAGEFGFAVPDDIDQRLEFY